MRSVAHRLGLGILQHPSEQHQAKGTARLAHLCLQDCPIWVGESVDALADLQAWLQAKPTLLLFPAQEDKGVDSAPNQVVYTENMSDTSVSEIQVLLLDGTWRKAYKLLQTNPALQALPRLQLSGEWQSAYAIRKAPNIRSLSTLEAIHAVLCELEGEPSRFDGLSLALADFVAQRKAFANGRDDSTRLGEKR